MSYYVLWVNRSEQKMWQGPFSAMTAAEDFRDGVLAGLESLIVEQEVDHGDQDHQ